MKQTPAHDIFNADLLRMIPADAKKIVECGSSSGVLARAYKKNRDCSYIGISVCNQSHSNMIGVSSFRRNITDILAMSS